MALVQRPDQKGRVNYSRDRAGKSRGSRISPGGTYIQRKWRKDKSGNKVMNGARLAGTNTQGGSDQGYDLGQSMESKKTVERGLRAQGKRNGCIIPVTATRERRYRE